MKSWIFDFFTFHYSIQYDKRKNFFASCEYAFSKINVCGIRDGFPLKSQKEIKKFNILFMPSKRSFDESCKYLARVGYKMELQTFVKKGND